MAGLLTWLMSKGDTAKRNLRAIARDPVGMLDLMAQQTAEDIRGTKYEREQDQARLRGKPYDKAAVDDLDRKRQENMLSLALTFAGPLAKTADKGLLAMAQEMTKAGENPFKVWQETGWTDQFPDGKWRFEIDDSGARFGNRHGNVDNFVVQSVSDPLTPISPHDLMRHDQLASAYPDTRNIGISFNKHSGGSYSEAFPETIALGNRDKVTLLHELQHAIQKREGFAKGGSPKAFAKEADPVAEYRKLAGEAEARLVEKRMNYTPEMRRAVAPWQQFDPPIDQQIVRFGDGPAMSVGADDLAAQLEAMRAANKAKGLPLETGTGDLRNEIARRNAVGMLGLPETNTAADRARAMGFDTDAYHGSNRDVYPGFDPAMLGENTGAASAKGAAFAATDKWTPQSYVFGTSELGQDYFLRTNPVPKIRDAENEAAALRKKRFGFFGIGGTNLSPDEASRLQKLDDIAGGERAAVDIASKSMEWTRDVDAFDADVPVNKWIPVSSVEDPTPNILPLKVNTLGMIDSFQEVPYYRDKTYAELISQAEQAGAPGTVIRNTQDGGPVTNILAIRDPSRIRSRFAAFDPARRSESDLLAGILPYAIPAGLLGLILTRQGEGYD